MNSTRATKADRHFKDATYEYFSRIGKALASPRRLELLDLLGQGPRTVESLAEAANMSIANASQHLQVLRAAGLVDATKRGLFVTYAIAGEDVADLYIALRRTGEKHVAELERASREFFAERDTVEGVDRQALLDRARSGEVIVLDVRPPEEYAAGHLPTARSIPLRELERRIGEIPRRKPIVAYCRGPYCVLAVKAVRLLRARGVSAFRLEDGIHEWRLRGLPVELPRLAPRTGWNRKGVGRR